MHLKKPKAFVDCKTIMDFAYRNRYICLTTCDAFEHTFGVPLRRFWSDNLTGFDIVAFNKWIGADDKCLRDVVAEKYGTKAVELIQNLI